MEPTRKHSMADAPSARGEGLHDEQADPEYDYAPISASIHVLSPHDNQSPGEGLQVSQKSLIRSTLDKSQHNDQDLTENYTDKSNDPNIAMKASPTSCSDSPDTSLQSNLVNETIRLDEKPEEKGSATWFQKSPPMMKDETLGYQLRNEKCTGYALGSAKDILQRSEITIPPTPPATALAPSFEPTAAICDGSLKAPQIEISADAVAIVSDHLCNSQMPPSDVDKPYPSGISTDPHNSPSEVLGHRNELTLDELVQGFNHFEDNKNQFSTIDESNPLNEPLHPDESIFAKSKVQEIENDAFTIKSEPDQEEGKDVGPEFMLDSSPIESSSSDTSSDRSTSDDDDDDDDDYEMLDPAEQAARLMQEDIGSDGEGTGRGNNGSGAGPPRTLNEKPEEVIPKPDLIITENMKIEELGHVENIIENLVLIKAKTSGEYQVLESGSVLCLEKRTVIGVVAETLGRVQQPFYTVHFTNAQAITEAGVSKGTKIFYVEQHSTSVFTQPLKNFKGSDASNLHDEEVGDEGIEFSDDEAEAEHKRKLKLVKLAKRDIREGSKDGSSQRGRKRGGKMQKRAGQNHPSQSRLSQVDYDEPESGDDLYTPLVRPPNLHEIMGQNEAPVEDQNFHRWADRGGRGGRGKGDRGRGRGDRGRGNRGHGGYRGNHSDNIRMASVRQNYAQPPGGGGTDLLPAPTDAPFAGYAAARQPQIGPPTPSINQPRPHHSPHHNHFGQSHNPYNQPNPQTSFYSPSSQTSHLQTQPAGYIPSSQPSQYFSPPPPSQYFPPTAHHQSAMPSYSQYHPHPPSPSPSTPNVPAGTFINPAFFPLAAQSTFSTWPQVNATQQASASANAGNSQMSSESERAFHAINILRNLSSRDESQPNHT